VQVNELCLLEAPILLTNTLSVPAATHGALDYVLETNAKIGEGTGTVNIVVGECNDSYLNTIRKFSVTPDHAYRAIKKASTKQVIEGAVGAGTGMVCFGYKGGIGTSSRLVVGAKSGTYVIGCLVLSNFGKRKELKAYPPFANHLDKVIPDVQTNNDGSIMMVLATNAPVNERQLNRIAKRCGIGLGRTGSHMAHGSGDIVIAFSTAQKIPHDSKSDIWQSTQLREDSDVMDQLFMAAAEVTEEAILNSLTMAKTTLGRKGRMVEGISY
jgi:D-aminopeptidase